VLLGGGWRQSESPIVSGARGSDGTGCEVAVRGWAGRSGSTCATSLARSRGRKERGGLLLQGTWRPHLTDRPHGIRPDSTRGSRNGRRAVQQENGHEDDPAHDQPGRCERSLEEMRKGKGRKESEPSQLRTLAAAAAAAAAASLPSAWPATLSSAVAASSAAISFSTSGSIDASALTAGPTGGGTVVGGSGSLSSVKP